MPSGNPGLVTDRVEIEDSSERFDNAVEVIESVGGELHDCYLTMGEYDSVTVAEFPDDDAAAKTLPRIVQAGAASSETMQAWPREGSHEHVTNLPRAAGRTAIRVSVLQFPMGRFEQFEHDRRRRIYEYVESQGAVEPETVRRNVLVTPETSSKPARSGPNLPPSTPMSFREFRDHVSTLERDGYLTERDGRLRVALPMTDAETTVELDDETEATVRPARQEDMDGVVGVVEILAAEDAYAVARRLADQVAREDVLLRHNEAGNRVFFVATVDDETVGWLHVEAVSSPMMDHTAELTVGVLAQYRGHGLGSTLMERGLDWAREQGLRKVYQSLPATNERAIGFLEDAGWSVESTREGHYHVDDELVDEVQLAIWLDA